MATYVDLQVHVIFATKHRQPWIGTELRPRLHAYIGGVLRHHGAIPYIVGGVEDHVHCLVGLKTTHNVADLVRETKKATTHWVREEVKNPAFAWQEGFAVFSVSPDHHNRIEAYIMNQEQHHKEKSSLEELEAILKEFRVSFDLKFLE